MTPSATIPHISAREAMRLVTRTELAREYLHIRPKSAEVLILWRRLMPWWVLIGTQTRVRLGVAVEEFDKMTRDGIAGGALSPGGRRAPEPVVQANWTSPVQSARQGATLEDLFDGWEK